MIYVIYPFFSIYAFFRQAEKNKTGGELLMMNNYSQPDLIIIKKNRTCVSKNQNQILNTLVNLGRRYFGTIYDLYITKMYKYVKQHTFSVNTRDKIFMVDNFNPYSSALRINIGSTLISSYIDTKFKVDIKINIERGINFDHDIANIAELLNSFLINEINSYLNTINEETNYSFINELNSDTENNVISFTIRFNEEIDTIIVYESYNEASKSLILLLVPDKKIYDRIIRKLILKTNQIRTSIPVPSAKRTKVKSVTLRYKIESNDKRVFEMVFDDKGIDESFKELHNNLLKQVNTRISYNDKYIVKYDNVKSVNFVIHPRVTGDISYIPGIKLCSVYLPPETNLTYEQFYRIIIEHDKFKDCCLIVSEDQMDDAISIIKTNNMYKTEFIKLVKNTISQIALNNCKFISQSIIEYLLGFPSKMLQIILETNIARELTRKHTFNIPDQRLCESLASLLLKYTRVGRIKTEKIDLSKFDENLVNKFIVLYSYQPIVIIP